MADKTLVFSNFRGGIADSYSLGSEGQFQDCKNVDFQSEPHGVKISAAHSDVLTSTAQVTGFLNTASAGLTGIFAHTADGKIYDADSGGTLSATITGNPRIFFIVPRTEKVVDVGPPVTTTITTYNYIFTEGKIHRANSDFSTITLDYKTFTGQPTDYYQYATTIYFASGSYLYSLDYLGTLTQEYEFPQGRLPSSMTFFQDTLRVYSNDQSDGWLDIFDIADLSAPVYETTFERTPVLGATNSGSYDYVLAGKIGQGDLYVCSGTQRQLVRSTNEGTGATRNFNGKCDSRVGDAYFVSTAGSRNNGIWKYSSGNPGLPTAISRIFDNSSYEVSAVLCEQSYVWVGYRNSSGEYKAARIETAVPPTYASEGEITTFMTDFGNPLEPKRINEVKIAYDCDNSSPEFPHGGEIEIYARKKRSDAWTKLLDTGVKPDVGTVKAFGSQFGDFHSVEFRFLLKSSGGRSPLLKAVSVTVSESDGK